MVRQAPGGNSSICLGMDNSPQKKRGVSANVFASGDNQNAGNFLTDRPTTRVVSAPGGASSCPFATDPDVNLGVARRPPVGGKVSVKLGDDCTHMEERKQAAAMARRHEEQQAKAQMERTAGVPARFDGDDKAKAQPAGMYGDSTSGSGEPAQKRRAPPGGYSSISLG